MAAKVRLRLGQGGSLNNRLDETRVKGAPEPVVGMGATILMYTDRHAGTITEVRTNKKGKATGIAVVEDKATRTDTNGMSESQTYSYERGEGAPEWYTRRVTGQWVKEGESLRNGQVVAIGYRNAYHDYSF